MTPRSTLERSARTRASTRLLLPLLFAAACTSGPPPEVPEFLVGGLDYTFDVPGTVPSGAVHVSFENRGDVRHELALARLRPGVTMTDLVQAMTTGGDPFSLIDGIGGILFAEAGETAASRLALELAPGRTYALLCTLQDTPNDPPHIALGMIRTFTVQGAEG